MSGCLRYNRSKVKAAFFLTNDLEVLYPRYQYLTQQRKSSEHTVKSIVGGPLR